MPLIDLSKSKNQPLVIPDEIARDTEVAAAIAALDTNGNFGRKFSHHQYQIGANQKVVADGWTFCLGSENTPDNSGQLYRANIGLGSGWPIGTYALEIGIKRYDPTKIYLRTQEAGIWSEWNAVGEFPSKLLTGNCPSTQNTTITISHGLDINRISGYSVMAFAPTRGWVLPHISNNGAIFYSCQLNDNLFSVTTRTNSESSLILGQPFKILVTYT